MQACVYAPIYTCAHKYALTYTVHKILETHTHKDQWWEQPMKTTISYFLGS